MKILGLTGKRGVGKSTVADMLVEWGFVRAHSFEPGKVAAVAYFRHLGADEETARRMTYGDLRDVPSTLLPGKATPRFFLERFGKFMGVTMGAGWTIGVEMAHIERDSPGSRLVVESVVYEGEFLRSRGGSIIRIVREGHTGPEGIESDAAQANIQVDHTLCNNGSLDDLRWRLGRIVAQ